MANNDQENTAYLNFIEDLNEILKDFDINKLSCS